MQRYKALRGETDPSSENIPLTHRPRVASTTNDFILTIPREPLQDASSWASSYDARERSLKNEPNARRHRDGLGRVESPANQPGRDDYYLRPRDARLVAFHVQTVSQLRDKMPWVIRLTEWIFRPSIAIEGFEDHPEVKSHRSGQVWARYTVGAIAVIVLSFWPSRLAPGIRNNGFYDSIPYREWLCSKYSRNPYETPENIGEVAHAQKAAKMLERDWDPKYLCFLRAPTPADPTSYILKRTETEPRGHVDDFVFVSYTRLHFPVNQRTEIDGMPLSMAQQAEELERTIENRQILLAWGCRAAENAGVKAFWIDFECIVADEAAGETEYSKSDVYRICDVMRVAHSMVIIRRPVPVKNAHGNRNFTSLQIWGSRIWTVPEALLCPGEKMIGIYTDHETSLETRDGETLPEYVEISKKNLVGAAWGDWKNMRQLFDHYDGSLHLTPLELVSITLEGLVGRVLDQIDPGTGLVHESQQKQVSHSLMGLLRRRPLADDDHQSGFEAFARLSLANDNDQLLERLLCFQTASHNDPWYVMSDAWGAKLWDIKPYCQIAGIVDSNTVTLDGAFGATIRWGDLKPVAVVKRTSWRNSFVSSIRLFAPQLLWVTIIFLATGSSSPSQASPTRPQASPISFQTVSSALQVVGGTLLAIAIILLLALPRMLLAQHGGKIWNTQAMLFGVEGIPDLGILERYIFGFNYGRMKWSGAGSRLSHQQCNKYGETIGLAPEPDPKSGQRLFTLIDTFTMTATAFYADEPPSIVLICGSEGGMQRAVLCSYDWQSQTFCRESVLRMKTRVLERMSRVDRVRFRLNRAGGGT